MIILHLPAFKVSFFLDKMIWNESELTGELVGRVSLMVGEIDYTSLQDFVMKNESAIQEREFLLFDTTHPIYLTSLFVARPAVSEDTNVLFVVPPSPVE